MYITAASGKDSVEVGPRDDGGKDGANPAWVWRETGHGSCSSRHTSVLARLATGTSFVEAKFCQCISRKEILQTLQEEYLNSTHSSQPVTTHYLISVLANS